MVQWRNLGALPIGLISLILAGAPSIGCSRPAKVATLPSTRHEPAVPQDEEDYIDADPAADVEGEEPSVGAVDSIDRFNGNGNNGNGDTSSDPASIVEPNDNTGRVSAPGRPAERLILFCRARQKDSDGDESMFHICLREEARKSECWQRTDPLDRDDCFEEWIREKQEECLMETQETQKNHEICVASTLPRVLSGRPPPDIIEHVDPSLHRYWLRIGSISDDHRCYDFVFSDYLRAAVCKLSSTDLSTATAFLRGAEPRLLYHGLILLDGRVSYSNGIDSYCSFDTEALLHQFLLRRIVFVLRPPKITSFDLTYNIVNWDTSVSWHPQSSPERPADLPARDDGICLP